MSPDRRRHSDPDPELGAAAVLAVDHVGFTVSDLDRSIDWYSTLLDEPPLLRRVWDESYIGDVVGYPGCRMDCALWRLPGGSMLELLRYEQPEGASVDMETFNAGNAHLCLQVADLDAQYRRLRAIAAFRSEQPVAIPAGPYRGGRVCYLRDPDGISVELIELPAAGLELSGEE